MSTACSCSQTLRPRQWAAGLYTSGRPHSRLHPARYNAGIGCSTCLRPQKPVQPTYCHPVGSPDNIHPQRGHNSNLPTGSKQNPLPAASLFPRPKRRHLQQCGVVHHPAKHRLSYLVFLLRHFALNSGCPYKSRCP